jgi:hypothetical protein
MLHLSQMRVFNNLNGTLIVTVDGSRGLNKKSKLTQKLVNPYFLCTYMNDVTIFCLCSRQGDYLFFLARPNQYSSAKEKHIAKRGLLIITVANVVEVGEADHGI